VKKRTDGGFLYGHRFSIGFFIYLVLYNFIVVTRFKFWEVSEKGTYMHHIIDYKTFGFREGMLPGSIYYGIFGENASVKSASIYETVLIILFFLAVSILLERFMKHVEPRFRTAALVAVTVFLSGPFTFAVFTDELGMPDVYLLFFAIVFFFTVENRILRFLIPAVFVLLTMVHLSALISYIVLLGILLLYRISTETEGNKKKALWAVFAISIFASAGMVVYLLAFKKEMPVSVNEFNSILESRGGKYFTYLDYTLYDYNYDVFGGNLYPQEIYSIANPVLRALKLAFAKLHFLHNDYMQYFSQGANLPLRFVISAVLLTPLMAFFYKHIFRLFKSIDGNRLKKFSVFLMMVQFPFTLILGYTFSLDIIRWVSHAFIISFVMFLYVLYREEQTRTEVLEAVEKIRAVPATYIYLLAYCFVNFSAYS